MLATVAAANIKKVHIKKYSIFIYREAEPHAMYAIYKQTLKLCVLQYLYEKAALRKRFIKCATHPSNTKSIFYKVFRSSPFIPGDLLDQCCVKLSHLRK